MRGSSLGERADVLVMATGDVASRPKGGWAEYRNGEHAKTGLHGKKSGELMGAQKAYGTGAYTDAPFRFRSIEEFVKSIRWFYDGLLEKMEGGPLNPASHRSHKTADSSLLRLGQ